MDSRLIEQALRDFLSASPLNIVEELDHLPIYEEPVIGIADADDPLFASFKAEEVIGPHHLLPREWMTGGRSVISYFLPFSSRVREANRTMGLPAREWLYGRIEGEECNVALRRSLLSFLKGKGYEAMAPTLDERFTVIKRRSNWSERHVAFAAGLGTISLSCSIITIKGSAGRLGSVIVSAPLTATPRYYTEKDGNCSHCGACIRRCPPLAITETGKDHEVCSAFLDRVLARYKPRYGCGKCQTAVPCENRIPNQLS